MSNGHLICDKTGQVSANLGQIYHLVLIQWLKLPMLKSVALTPTDSKLIVEIKITALNANAVLGLRGCREQKCANIL